MPEKIVIIGAGQAAAQAVQSLRAEGFAGPITLVGDEAYAPYQRPPLSKAYLLGQFERPRLFLKSDSYYPEAGCELLLGTSAAAIHRAPKTVELGDEFICLAPVLYRKAPNADVEKCASLA